MAHRVGKASFLTLAMKAIGTVAVVGVLVTIALYWFSVQNASPREAAAYIVSDYGASSAHCRDVGPNQFLCQMSYRGCSTYGRIDYDGPGNYLWVPSNPLVTCRGYRQP
jgi:hypothetical protein